MKKWTLAKKVIEKKQYEKAIDPWTSANFYPH